MASLLRRTSVGQRSGRASESWTACGPRCRPRPGSHTPPRAGLRPPAAVAKRPDSRVPPGRNPSGLHDPACPRARWPCTVLDTEHARATLPKRCAQTAGLSALALPRGERLRHARAAQRVAGMRAHHRRTPRAGRHPLPRQCLSLGWGRFPRLRYDFLSCASCGSGRSTGGAWRGRPPRLPPPSGRSGLSGGRAPPRRPRGSLRSRAWAAGRGAAP